MKNFNVITRIPGTPLSMATEVAVFARTGAGVFAGARGDYATTVGVNRGWNALEGITNDVPAIATALFPVTTDLRVKQISGPLSLAERSP